MGQVGPGVTEPASQPITYEEMLAEAEAAFRSRLALRRLMISEGALKGPLYDRRQQLLKAKADFIARCMVKRREVSELLRGVTIRPIDDEADAA